MNRNIFVVDRGWMSWIVITFSVVAFFLTITCAGWAVENGSYPNGKFLVTTQWLADHLKDPNVRILDRQDVEPDEEFYAKGHIPNSIRMTTAAVKGMRLGIQEMLVVKDLIRFPQQGC